MSNFTVPIFVKKEELTKNDCKMHTIVRVEIRPAKGRALEGRIVEVFPDINDPSLELAIVEENHGFPVEFSRDVLDEAESVNQLKPGKRRDLTRAVIVTIDGETARDFDDAISVDELPDGSFNLKVSIADVSHFVREGSAIDREALRRGTSIYFPDRAIPMLPEVLSNNLCSLVPNEPRFTLTCEMEFSKSGERTRTSIYPSTIQSRARLTYTQVSRVLEHNEESLVSAEVLKLLRSSLKLSHLLREKRSRRGALDLDIPEVEIKVDKAGDITNVGLSERNEAHKLIEDFMIAANEAVSEAIEAKDFSSVYRVHESPDPMKIERLKLIAKRWGFTISEKKGLVDALQNYLDSAKGHPNQKILTISLLRSMKQAHYSASNVGHFGLGSGSYCHFTSPIRRYPDLLIHRILRKSDFLKADREPLPQHELAQLAETCSEYERRAFLAARDMEDIKKTRFMESYVGREYTGTVVSVKSFGLFVEIEPYFIDGLVPVRSLPKDYYEPDELETSLRGRNPKRQFWLGDRIRVQVSQVNRLSRQITLRYVRHVES